MQRGKPEYRLADRMTTALQQQMDRLADTSLVGGERADATDHCLAGIVHLSNEVKDAASYIPTYDQRVYAEVSHHTRSGTLFSMFCADSFHDRPSKPCRRSSMRHEPPLNPEPSSASRPRRTDLRSLCRTRHRWPRMVAGVFRAIAPPVLRHWALPLPIHPTTLPPR